MNNGHQLRFTTVLLVQMTTVMLAIGFFAYMESERLFQLVLGYMTEFPVASHGLHMTNQAFLAKIILVIGVAAVAQIMFGIYMSHKLAGPVVKMTQVMDTARSGDYSVRVKFRSGDDLEELSTQLNRVLESLDAERSQKDAQIEEIARVVARMKQSDENNPEEMVALRASVAKFTDIEIATLDACSR